jgi:multiple sugar transport system ATP-binding protein
LALPVPPARAGKYVQHKGNGSVLLGLRPEHLTEARAQLDPGVVAFDANLDVTEPMGMETLVYFPINGETVCGRVNPAAGAKEGAPLKMAADLNNMHLIDPKSGLVL